MTKLVEISGLNIRFTGERTVYAVNDLSLSLGTREVLGLLQPHWMVDYDETQSIGRRYRRQDEVGTPYCVTVDFESLEDHAVTVRARDTMAQERVPIEGITSYFSERFVGC